MSSCIVESFPSFSNLCCTFPKLNHGDIWWRAPCPPAASLVLLPAPSHNLYNFVPSLFVLPLSRNCQPHIRNYFDFFVPTFSQERESRLGRRLSSPVILPSIPVMVSLHYHSQIILNFSLDLYWSCS